MKESAKLAQLTRQTRNIRSVIFPTILVITLCLFAGFHRLDDYFRLIRNENLVSYPQKQRYLDFRIEVNPLQQEVWMNAQKVLLRQRWFQLQREMMGLWLRIEGFLLDGHIGPFIGWRISGLLNWDVYAVRWPPFGARGVFKLRIHFAVCRFSFRRWKFERPGGASGTRIGVDWGLQGWQIGFDNGWQETKDRNKWIITRFVSFPGTYPYKILPWSWHPFWYPRE